MFIVYNSLGNKLLSYHCFFSFKWNSILEFGFWRVLLFINYRKKVIECGWKLFQIVWKIYWFTFQTPFVKKKSRAGSGHFFSGPGRVRAGLFWPGSGLGWPFLSTATLGCWFWPILTHFWPIFQLKVQLFWFGLGRATQNLAQVGSDLSKPMAHGFGPTQP